MPILIVVNNPQSWPLAIPGADVISARSYLTEATYSDMRGAKVFNLCRSYSYQSIGYYVSLLAMARGHKPLPSISTIQDLKSLSIIRTVGDELEELIQHSLRPIQSDLFTLSIYFGRNVAKRYDRLSSHLFKLFQAPFLRAEFRYDRDDEWWMLHNISPISANDIPQELFPFLIEAATQYFESSRWSVRKRTMPRYDLAILRNEDEEEPPSDERALQHFVRAAKRIGLGVELIDKDDYGQLPQFDALFIRETTQVNNHTYRFARRAAAEGLVVVDDPESIAKCTNKVYLEELLGRYAIPKPKTLIVHRDNVDAIPKAVGLPCILKEPDSSFSQGVYKAEDESSLRAIVSRLLDESELIIAQEFMPTTFDWRVGIFDRQPLYVCKYHMAPKHWQIQRKDHVGKIHFGKVDTLPLAEAPPQVVRTAIRAANLIGNGLYGVDLKHIGRKTYIIEVNDNPSIDSGVEDAQLKDALYQRIMSVFLQRIEQRKEARNGR